jgi:hypothetical protein
MRNIVLDTELNNNNVTFSLDKGQVEFGALLLCGRRSVVTSYLAIKLKKPDH